MDNSCDQTFHGFPQLPTELRLAIWKQCLPDRVVELDYKSFEHAYWSDDSPPCTMQKTSDLNRRPPVISRVCRESRQIAFETGYIYNGGSPPPEAQWKSSVELKSSWIDPFRDSVHLNWIPSYRMSEYGAGSALDYLAWRAAQARGGSFMFDYMHGTMDGNVNIKDRIGALRQLRHPAIVMRTIVVHTFQNATKTGLFGLLGDAPIQLVDISDESRLDAFFDFAEKCESDSKGWIMDRQDFHRDSPGSVRIALEDELADAFGAEAARTLPLIRPVIMFRLCLDWCNHSSGYAEWARDIGNNDPDKSERGYLKTEIREDFRNFAEAFRMR